MEVERRKETQGEILIVNNIKMSALLVPAAFIFALNVITTQPTAQANDPTMKALKLGKIQAKRKRKPNVIKFTPKTPKSLTRPSSRPQSLLRQ